MCTTFKLENLKGTNNLGNPGVDGRIITKLISYK
jgi:hypothetical protein